jgi:hypothetical protein
MSWTRRRSRTLAEWCSARFFSISIIFPPPTSLRLKTFYRPPTMVFFGEIRAMAKRGLPTDTSMLIGRFNEKKILELGGRGAIFELTECQPRHYKDLPKHMDVILDAANKRRAQLA